MAGTASSRSLHGGNLNAGVVRVGDTVRRGTGPWTPAVHALLRHLERAHFAGAPRLLGSDEQGREVLRWLPGRTYFPPATAACVWTDASLDAVARLLRGLHDATAGWQAPAGARWTVMVGAPAGGEVVCHNDASPWNTVFRRGAPSALIDWDLAAPGARSWDLAYAAWRFVPLCDDRRASRGPLPERAPRLRRFCDAYGLEERLQLLDAVAERQLVHARTIRRWGAEGRPGWDRLLARGHAQLPLEDHAWLERHRAQLEAALA